jgi:hypothetical protein
LIFLHTSMELKPWNQFHRPSWQLSSFIAW